MTAVVYFFLIYYQIKRWYGRWIEAQVLKPLQRLYRLCWAVR